MDAAADKVLKELREIVAAAEDLLAAPGAGAERMKEIRGSRAEEARAEGRQRLEPAVADLENQVRRHPLAALGIAASVRLVVGLLLQPQMSAGLLDSARGFVAGLLDLGRALRAYRPRLREELAPSPPP